MKTKQIIIIGSCILAVAIIVVMLTLHINKPSSVSIPKVISKQDKVLKDIPSQEPFIQESIKKDIEISKEAPYASDYYEPRIADYIAKFKIPPELEKELLDIAREGEIEYQWDKDSDYPEPKHTLQVRRLILSQIISSYSNKETINLSSGHNLSEDNLDDIVNTISSQGDDDDEDGENDEFAGLKAMLLPQQVFML